MVNINIVIPDDLHKALRIEAALKEKQIKELLLDYLEKEVRGGFVGGKN